jgi:peptidoglycan/LPS O-acetylase OafA/YrhL
MLGDLTYPLYLVHWPIIYLVDTLWPHRGIGVYGVIVLASLGAAMLVLLLERPLTRLRDRVRRRRLYEPAEGRASLL